MSEEDRRRALEQIAALAGEHRIGLREIEAALAGEAAPGREARRRVLLRALGYLGGIFIFAGIGVLVATRWDTMNAAARVIVTLGPGLVAFVLALLARGDERFEKATTPLFLIAAVLEPTGMLVAFGELGGGGDWRIASLITAAAMAAQLGLTFAGLRRPGLLFLTLLFGVSAAATAMDLLGIPPEWTGLVLGAVTLGLTAGLERSRHAVITPFWYFASSLVALYALFDIVRGSPLEIVFLAAASGCVSLSVSLRSRPLLVVSTLALLAYTGYFTGEHFADSVGWPVALIGFGLALIGMGALAVRIDRRYLRDTG